MIKWIVAGVLAIVAVVAYKKRNLDRKDIWPKEKYEGRDPDTKEYNR